MNDILSAIVAIDPSAQVSIRDGDLDQITWHNDAPVIPKADIVAMMAELKADYDSKQYSRDRQAEYPSIEELVVALYDSEDKAEIDRRRAEVKNKYPKP